MKDVKLCVNCKFVFHDAYTGYECHKKAFGKVDIVKGGPTRTGVTGCYRARSKRGFCGPSGKFYKPKLTPTTPEPTPLPVEKRWEGSYGTIKGSGSSSFDFFKFLKF